MRQIGTQSSKCFRKIVTFVLAFAMIITSLAVSSTESQAATKKVKKVTIGVKVGGSGILVLKKGQTKKLKVTVSPKKASKKVTYKSSKKSVVSVSSKGVVKARKSKGSAKITVTSKQNAKKKATIKVKIGTPIKKVSIQNKAVVSWTSANWVLKEVNGQKKKIWPSYKQTVTAKKSTYEVMKGRTITLKTSTSPKKATYKKYYWKSNKTSVATIPAANKVGSSTKVSTKKEGTATITAKAMDGSGKTAKVKIKVVKFITDKTPAPTATPDPRKTTMLEDFEKYDPGTAWNQYTAAGKNSGHMIVVQDPENAENKCLQVVMDGTDNAYDFAPALTVDLSQLKDSDGNSTAGKTLGNYTGIKIDARVVGNDSDIKYKKIYCYFDQAGNIKTTDYFATNLNEGTSAHVDGHPEYRFGEKISMAEGSDAENGTVLWNNNSTKESNKYFPLFYDSTWQMENASTHYAVNSCTTGYKMTEADAKVGFATRSLNFNTGRIKEADATLLDQSKFDVVIGSTYSGAPGYAATATNVTYYIDNIALIEEEVAIQDFTLSIPEGQDIVYPGGDVTVNTSFTPADTTQKELVWTTNNNKVTVDGEGKVTVAEDFEFANNETTEVVVSATSKANPALTKSVTIKVVPIVLPTEPYVVDFGATYDAELSGDLKPEKGADEHGTYYEFKFTGANQRIYFKLPEEVNLSAYQKYELTGYSEMQITLDFWDATLPEAMAKTETDTYKWYRSWAAHTTPFHEGSCANRLSDGTFVKPWAIETESNLLSGIKSTQATDAVDTPPGNFNKVKYIAIGNAIRNSPEDGGTAFRIYDLRLTPRPQGNLPELPVATLPLSESFENAEHAMNIAINSKIIEGTEDAPAHDGTKYMEVSAEDCPTIILDNREGTEDKTYDVSAYVKAKEPSSSGIVGFINRGIFQGNDYSTYVGYELLSNLLKNKTTKIDLSAAGSDPEWQKIYGRVKVSAGKLSEVGIGSIDEKKKFEFYLDYVTVSERE